MYTVTTIVFVRVKIAYAGVWEFAYAIDFRKFLYSEDDVTYTCTAWCSEIGSLTSLDACNSGASNNVREPISLHQAVHVHNIQMLLNFVQST